MAVAHARRDRHAAAPRWLEAESPHAGDGGIIEGGEAGPHHDDVRDAAVRVDGQVQLDVDRVMAGSRRLRRAAGPP